MTPTEKRLSLVLHLALGALAALWLLPLWLMVVYSTHTPETLYSTPMPLWPGDQFAVNLTALQGRVSFFWAIGNSVLVSSLFTLGSLAITTLAAYAFWRWPQSGVRYLFALILLTMAIPAIALTLPQYVLVARNFGLGNTYAGLLLPYFANAIGVFFMRQIFAGLPLGIIDAARIDGAGEWRIFYSIALPLVIPGMAALAIILFLTAWTDYLWPLLILTDADSVTAPVAMGVLMGGYRVDWAIVMAAAVLVTLPFVVLFLFLQRFLISGITAGAMK